MPGVIYHAYEIPDRPGARLVLGVQPGQVRPTLWVDGRQDGVSYRITLASFHGENELKIATNFLDTLIDVINRVIAHLDEQHGDEHGERF